MALALATGAAACASPVDDRRTVRLDGAPWTVLRAGDDGMRARTDFDGADGMLFDLERETDPSAVMFVMDGVLFPLDIAWFAADGRLVGTTSMPLCSTDPCPRHAAPAPFRWALEAPLDAFADLDLAAGDVRLDVPD